MCVEYTHNTMHASLHAAIHMYLHVEWKHVDLCRNANETLPRLCIHANETHKELIQISIMIQSKTNISGNYTMTMVMENIIYKKTKK